jgi:gluconolactonase
MNHLDVRDTRLERIVSDEPMRKRAGGFRFTEGPVWHAADGVVIFSDIPGDRMYRFNPTSERVDIYREPSNKANGNVLDHEHRLLTCEHATSRVVRQEADGGMTVIAAHYDGIELNSPNDIVVDRDGRLYFTDPPYGRHAGTGPLAGVGVERPQLQPVQGVYRVDPRDGSVVRLADDFDQPNGLCFAEEESVLYVNDTARRHIRRYEVRGGGLVGGEVWAEVGGAGPGVPDGMKVDSEGNLFCCGPGGVHVFSGKGQILGVILVPEPCGNFNWGDADRRTLYLCATTSLFSCRMRVPGIAAW